MHATTTFDRARISKVLVAVFIALVVAFVLGGASGYLIKGLSLPIATATQQGAPPFYAPLSDTSTRSHRGGPQTMEEQPPNETTAGETGPRHSGLQLP
jgi:hypothetical protein